jgi:glycosyltransferase involved in cell wall biosynthesis
MSGKVSVIIATRNRKEYLPKTLESFNNQSYRNFEILVVEDGSSYNQEESLKNLHLDFNLRYYYIENRGRAGARNYGIQHSDGEIILFFDDHSVPTHTLIEKHVKNHLKHACHGGLRGRIEYIQDYKSSIEYKKPRFFTNLKSILVQNDPIVQFGTHNLSIKRKILDKVGLLDEEFTLYGAEDQEFGIRIRKAGYRLGYLATALSFNVKIRKGTEETLRRAIESGKMAALLIKKHPEFKSKIGLHIMNKILYDRKKNRSFYMDFIENRICIEDVKHIKKSKFILYYYSTLDSLGFDSE